MQINEDDKGWLLSCDQNRQKQALKDAYNFLTQYIQQVYDDVVSQAILKKIKQQNKQHSLQTELKQSQKKQYRLLYSIQTKVKCLIFVKINQKFKQIDPIVVVEKIMEDVCAKGRNITRYCHKILPVQRAFKAEHFKMLDVVDQLFLQKTSPNQVKSWALNFKCRNNSKFNYKEVLRQCEKIALKYGHFVDIYYPQWTVSIEIVNHLMCISISEKFKQYNQYRLHKKVPQQQREPHDITKKEEQQQQEIDYGLKSEKQLRQKLNKKLQIQESKNGDNQKDKNIQNETDKELISYKEQQEKQEKQQQQKRNERLMKQVIKPSQEDDVQFF